MIGQPPGWSRTYAGTRVFLFPPEGPELGAIRYDERRSPLLTLDAVLREQCDRVENAMPAVWTRGVTIEGEHTSVITFEGTLDGRVAQIDLGVILLDECYALINAYCFDRSAFASFSETVRELTRGDMHFLGVRRRRFDYTRPPGWHERTSGYVQQYAAPFGSATLTVWPALPTMRVGAELFATMLSMRGARRYEERIGDLDALSLIDDTNPSHLRHAIILACDRYIYPVHLEVADGLARHDMLHELVESIEGIPRMRVPEEAFGGLAHWSE